MMESKLSKEELDEIKRALENVKRGKVKPIDQVARNLKVKLL